MEPSPIVSAIPSFIESLVGLLVFGISIPSIIINVPPRIRAIREKYAYVFNIGPQKIKASKILQPEFVVVLIVLSIIFFLSYLIPPFFTCSNGATIVLCAIQGHFVNNAAYWIGGVLIANVITTALFISLLTSFTRDKVILHLGKVCRNQAEANQGRIDSALFNNLGELGEFCDPGSDKQAVLGTIEKLLSLDLTPESWAGLAQTVRQIIADGNEQNIAVALELLQEIIQRAYYSTKGEAHVKDFSIRDISKELEEVFLQAFTMDSPSVMSKMMQGYDELTLQPTNDAAKAFLRIGRMALKTGSLNHAINALSKLHTQITEILDEFNGHCPLDKLDALYAYFALVSYFWVRGSTMRTHVLSHLEQLQEDYHWDDAYLARQIQDAGMAMYGTNMETPGYLEQMLFNYRQWCLARSMLAECDYLTDEQQQHILSTYPSIESIQKANVIGLMACGIARKEAEAIMEKVNE
ncbi:MAG: hypothetical protein AAF702_32045 [Chloroflexota bacterium]